VAKVPTPASWESPDKYLPETPLEDAVVGDRERIDADVADALVSRLHAAGLALHRTLDLPLSAEARSHIESAIDEIDGALRVIRVAATNFDTPGESGSPT